MLTESEFLLALAKERCRAERRELSFCVIVFDACNNALRSVEQNETTLANRFRKRLRLTDEIGVYQGLFAVLLPETIASQAATVATELTKIAHDHDINLTTEIFVFPEVDMGNKDDSIEDRHPLDDSGLIARFDQAEQIERAGDLDGGNEGGLATIQRKVTLATTQTLRHEKKSPVNRSIPISRLDTSVPTPVSKRMVDILGAGCGIVLLSPVFAIAALLVKLDSRGPVFFTQWREGKDGRLFRIYKFRTMRVGADDEKDQFRNHSEQDGPAFKIKNDPRLTKIGVYLRKSCVDELPQLLNVLKGEMSLVGPRPLPVDESLNCSPWHRRRLDVLPGMTCIWQVDGGRDIPFDEWMRMDLDYVRQQSLSSDLKLIFKTALVTIMHRGSV